MEQPLAFWTVLSAIIAGYFGPQLLSLISVPVPAVPLAGHKIYRCDQELRELLEVKSSLDWYRWALLFTALLLAATAVALVIVVAVCAGLCRCCGPTRGAAPETLRRGTPIKSVRGDSKLLSLLAVKEVRR